MTQSASSPYPIRPIGENELDDFLNVDEHAFNTSPWSDSDRQVGVDRFEVDRTLAAFDDRTPVGVTMCYSFQLSAPGLAGAARAAGDLVGVRDRDLRPVRLRPRQLAPRLHAAARRGRAVSRGGRP